MMSRLSLIPALALLVGLLAPPSADAQAKPVPPRPSAAPKADATPAPKAEAKADPLEITQRRRRIWLNARDRRSVLRAIIKGARSGQASWSARISPSPSKRRSRLVSPAGPVATRISGDPIPPTARSSRGGVLRAPETRGAAPWRRRGVVPFQKTTCSQPGGSRDSLY